MRKTFTVSEQFFVVLLFALKHKEDMTIGVEHAYKKCFRERRSHRSKYLFNISATIKTNNFPQYTH